LGIALVAGSMRVPNPATGKTAFRITGSPPEFSNCGYATTADCRETDPSGRLACPA
jgi:hypothetical protein